MHQNPHPPPPTFPLRDTQGAECFLETEASSDIKAYFQESVRALVSSIGKAGARESTYMCC